MHSQAAASRLAFLRRLALGLALALTLASTSARAQGGGFFAGDVYVASDAVHVLGGTGASLQRIVPLSGAVTPLVGGFGQSGANCLAFDPYRQRLIWRAAVGSIFSTHVWLVDAAGTLTDTGLPTNTGWFAPTGDGRIYMSGGSNAFQWLDAANVTHTLLDATGLQPYKVDGVNGYDLRGMVYSSASNSLILTSPNTCGSAAPGDAIFRRVPLSADGTQVIGPADCASYDVMGPTTTLGIGPKGLALLPDGRVLLTTDNNGGLPNTVNLPRLLVLDPVAFTLAPFAFTGNYPTAHVVDAGVFTQSLGKALILDSFADDLRAWAEGEVGPGTEIPPVGGIVSSSGGSAEAVELAAIPASSCSGAWLPFGGVSFAGSEKERCHRPASQKPAPAHLFEVRR